MNAREARVKALAKAEQIGNWQYNNIMSQIAKAVERGEFEITVETLNHFTEKTLKGEGYKISDNRAIDKLGRTLLDTKFVIHKIVSWQ